MVKVQLLFFAPLNAFPAVLAVNALVPVAVPPEAILRKALPVAVPVIPVAAFAFKVAKLLPLLKS